MPEQRFQNALAKDYRLYWYTIERVLGHGGFGITYLARDTNLDQPVAIKEYLPAETAGRGENFTVQSRTEIDQERFKLGLDRFMTEARILARFDHPNIIRIHSVFEANNTAYLVMRYEQGIALNDYLDRHKFLGEQELLDIVLPVLDGLKRVHKLGFIHRDIQPANIYIREDGTPVLLDFGAAREAMGKTRTMTILLAPGYAPIEQYFSDAKAQGPWTDIYGLGAVLYRAVAGAAPLDAIERSRGLLGSARDVMMPASVAGQGRYSENFLRAIDHALAFNEKDRPQSIEVWETELQQLTPVTIPAPAPNAPLATQPSKPPQAAVSGRGFKIAAVAAAIMLPVLGIAVIFWPRGYNQTEAIEETVAADRIAILEQVSQPVSVPETHQLGTFPDEPATDQVAEAPSKNVIPPEPAAAEHLETTVQPGLPESATQQAATRSEEPSMRPEEAETRRLKEEAESARLEVEQLRAARQREEQRLFALTEQRREAETRQPATQTEAPQEAVGSAPTQEAEELQKAIASLQREDYPAAITLLTPLAEKGETMAQYQLARLYRSGRGVLANNGKALVLMRRAAWQGKPEAQADLAGFYRDGIDGVQDFFLAYTWFLVLERNGDYSRVNERRSLEGQLQAEQFIQAAHLAEDLQQVRAEGLDTDSGEEE